MVITNLHSFTSLHKLLHAESPVGSNERNRLTAISLITNVFSISTRLVGNAFLAPLRYQSETCFPDAAGSGPALGKRHFAQLRLRGHCRAVSVRAKSPLLDSREVRSGNVLRPVLAS